MSVIPRRLQAPARRSYDVVIAGGAIMGASVAWFLASNPDFGGTILVVERDPSYENTSTARSNSCIRQQFSTEINVRISRFAGQYITNLRAECGGDPDVHDVAIRNFGYLYLAATPDGEAALKQAAAVQHACGTPTELLSPEDVLARYPWYDLSDIRLCSLNTENEGYWDGYSVFETWRRLSRKRGAEWIENAVTGLERDASGTRITNVCLASGERIACGTFVNCAGPRAAAIAEMAGIALPVEPRKRYTWVFTAERPLPRDLPLTIDPSGVHVRQDGDRTYMAGAHGDHDPAVDPDDFAMDQSLWMDKVWPAIATRIPQFEAIRVIREWAGHYAYNTLDQNAICGPHDEVTNFLFVNGFSGHGLQQSPAMGRGTAEWIIHGGYRTLDLSPLHFGRIRAGRPHLELAII